MPRTSPAERRFTEIGQAVTDARFVGVGVFDAEGKIGEVDHTLAELLGYAPAELAGLPWSELTPERYRPLDARAADALREHGRFSPYEKHLLRADGTEVPVLVGGAALAGPQP